MREILSILTRSRPEADRLAPDEPPVVPTTQPHGRGGCDRLLLSEDDVADLLSVTRGAVRRLSAGGKLPAPIRLGNFTRWRRAEIQAWVAAGCPDRENWTWDSADASRASNASCPCQECPEPRTA